MSARMSILIVEDDAIIALALSLAAEDAGADVVGPVGTVAEALALIHSDTISAAVVDANLQDRDISPVVMLMTERAIPFVVHTGTGLPDMLREMRPLPTVVMKPASPRSVVGAVLAEMPLERL